MLSSSARDETTSPSWERQCACDGRGLAKHKSFDRLGRKERRKGQLMSCRGKGLSGTERLRRSLSMGNGDGRVHSTKADTSRCSLEMSDSSRDCRPSRTSHAGPAAPGQRPCTSTNKLDP